MKPWDAEAFEWDDGNEGELARHGISPREVEQVFLGGPTWGPDTKAAAADWKMVGTTSGGRRLTICVETNDTFLTLRPITGWESTPGEIARYGKGKT